MNDDISNGVGIFIVPKASKWKAHFAGLVYNPEDGKEPNWLHRQMQWLVFGIRWEKAP